MNGIIMCVKWYLRITEWMKENNLNPWENIKAKGKNNLNMQTIDVFKSYSFCVNWFFLNVTLSGNWEAVHMSIKNM